MFTVIRLPQPSVTAPEYAARQTLSQRLARWLMRLWESECRRAERPDRVVPYY